MNTHHTNQRRVVVTGMGALTPIGLSLDEYWQNALAGKNGVGKITSFDVSQYDTKIAAELKGFIPLDFIDRKEANRMDPFTQYGMAAAVMAVSIRN